MKNFLLVGLVLVMALPISAQAQNEESCWCHSADTNCDWSISLVEVLRVVQIFNMLGYCPANELLTEDGFTVFCPPPEEIEGTPHSADTNGDWRIDLFEILRVVQLFNLLTFGVDCEGTTQDGFLIYGTVRSCGPCDLEGEGSTEGEPEGEGEGQQEGEPEPEGEGSPSEGEGEGEGEPEPEGEGQQEGEPEPEGEGSVEGEPIVPPYAETLTITPFQQNFVVGDTVAIHIVPAGGVPPYTLILLGPDGDFMSDDGTPPPVKVPDDSSNGWVRLGTGQYEFTFHADTGGELLPIQMRIRDSVGQSVNYTHTVIVN